jgi:DNA mismatch repair ATPase MutS
MKVFLMHRNADFDLYQELPSNQQELTDDLQLGKIFDAMALGDAFLFDAARAGILSALKNGPDTILYRQEILQDCLRNTPIILDMYHIALESIESEKKNFWGIMSKHPSSILTRSIQVVRMFVDMLRKLRRIADLNAGAFHSEGFTRFFGMLEEELSDDIFTEIEDHLRELKFGKGVLISAELGKGNKGDNYRLHRVQDRNEKWTRRIFARKAPAYSFSISQRDDSGARALVTLKDAGLNLSANALARSTDHILSFFTVLRTELAFYVGCLNLHRQLVETGGPVSFPIPAPIGERRHLFRDLYDAGFALTIRQRITGNEVDADDKDLVIITGANQGGKSTFLRSMGTAQLMMQSGMFVAAESFCSNVCDGLFTHYRREEDATMKSGKLDEELARMSGIIDVITPNSMVLLNESFAATNDREGSEIARQIVSALAERRIKILFVTHLYEFARAFHDKKKGNVLFLRTERETDGRRTFRLIEGAPSETSYGEDLYRQVFGESPMPVNQGPS